MPMNLRLGATKRSTSNRQELLTFLERSTRRQRRFKQVILAATLLLLAGMIGWSQSGRYRMLLGTAQARDVLARRLFGLEPDRAQVDADWQLRRQHGIEETRKSLTGFYASTTEEMRELFRVAGMDPEHALIRYGRGDQAFVISPEVFEPDERGRSYRFRPNTRSVWLRQITIRGGPFAMFQVLDTPRHRAAAARAGAIVDEGSIQNTNSWGLRGAEPQLSAPVRGIVLGDSFMQAMFNGDGDTPPVDLERYLQAAWKVPVSILNTGHIGYSPEQYSYSLREYGDRFPPRFVVVSVCPNDFGDGMAVLRGEGDWYKEAKFWLDEIQRWCRSRSVVVLVVSVPTFLQVETVRKDALYPGQVCGIVNVNSSRYCYPLDEFIDEHLRLAALPEKDWESPTLSKLYNRKISDDHFSPRGAALWAQIVGRRLVRLFALQAAKTGQQAPGSLSSGAGPTDREPPR
jgi:hypothetical protein